MSATTWREERMNRKSKSAYLLLMAAFCCVNTVNDMSGYCKGLYIMQVSTPGGVMTNKIVLQ